MTLKETLIQELKFHQQAVARLQKMIQIYDGTGALPDGIGLEPSGTATSLSGELKVYKKRFQTPESRAKIGAYQRERHKKAREAKAAKEAESTAAGSVGRS